MNNNIPEWHDIWFEPEEKMPATEAFIDVVYLDGRTENGVRPATVEMIEVECWREHSYRVKRTKAGYCKEYLNVVLHDRK